MRIEAQDAKRLVTESGLNALVRAVLHSNVTVNLNLNRATKKDIKKMCPPRVASYHPTRRSEWGEDKLSIQASHHQFVTLADREVSAGRASYRTLDRISVSPHACA